MECSVTSTRTLSPWNRLRRCSSLWRRRVNSTLSGAGTYRYICVGYVSSEMKNDGAWPSTLIANEKYEPSVFDNGTFHGNTGRSIRDISSLTFKISYLAPDDGLQPVRRINTNLLGFMSYCWRKTPIISKNAQSVFQEMLLQFLKIGINAIKKSSPAIGSANTNAVWHRPISLIFPHQSNKQALR